ncbi:MAG: energy transducer TonB [Alphaproteobacteria bacterium]|nr:energy transducer TonB [Alphaproteobacteria bacterium]
MKTRPSRSISARPYRRRRFLLLFALIASAILHLSFFVPMLISGNLFAAKAPPPEPIPVEIVSLPPQPPPEEPKAETPPPPAQEKPPEPPPKPEAKPEPPKPEPPPEREVTGAIALRKAPVKPRDQITEAEHKMPPVVVRPQPPGRAGNSMMPSYPSAARANGLQGRVVLLVTLSLEGRPRRIDIARSSGHDQLDESAVRAVWLWRFYRSDQGPPVEATIEIPLDFRL